MTQTQAIRAALESGATLTPLDALQRFGTLRLSERIRELEREGMLVEHEPYVTSSGKRVMSYRLLRIAFG